MRARRLAAVMAISGLTAPARADVELGHGFALSGMVLGVSDFVFRGISQTRGRPALQGSLELAREGGLYIGAFASNVAFPDTNARQELDLSAGYRVALGTVNLDIAATAYTYPGYRAEPGQNGLNYAEVILRVAHDIGPVTLVGTAALQPSALGPYGTGYYLSGRATWQTPLWGLLVAGEVGYQWIGDNGRYGVPDYLSYGAAIAREIALGFVAVGTVTGTNIPRADCMAGQKVCGTRFVAGLAWRF